MDTKQRLYIVRFGNSAAYRLEFSGTKEELEASPRMKEVEDTLAEYLKSKIPVCNHVKRLTTPVIHEVESEDAPKYAGYRELDAEAIEALKHVVLTEARNYQDQKELDRNAPFADIN